MLNPLMNIDVAKLQTVYDKARELIKNDDCSSAVMLLEDGVKQLENVNACFFDEIFSLVLWFSECQNIYGRAIKKNRNLPAGYAIDRVNLYYLLGYSYVELGDNEKAMESLKKVLKFHPYDVHSRFEIVQILKNECNFDIAREVLRDIHHYIFRPEDLAHFYRDYGWIFAETGEWKAAAACYISSLAYADKDGCRRAWNEVDFVEHSSGKDLATLLTDGEERIELLSKYQIPLGFDESIVNIAFSEYEKSRNGENENLERYYREICLVYVNPLSHIRDTLLNKMEELKNCNYNYKFFGEKNEELHRIITISLEMYYKKENAAWMSENAAWDIFEMQVGEDIREKIFNADEKVDITEELKEWLDLQC